MEQLTFTEPNSFLLGMTSEEIDKILTCLSVELNVDKTLFMLKPNQTKGVLIGHSITFNKSLVAKVSLKKASFSANKKYAEIISKYTESKELSSPNNFMRFNFIDTIAFKDMLQKVVVAFVNDYSGSIEFGCCHRYVECSDLLKCIAPDQARAKSCLYRKNLECGRIFYGKNKNV